MALNNRIRSEIDQMTCSVHKERPFLVIVDGRIQVSSCCPEFKIICLRKLIHLLIELEEQELAVSR
jgi:hypothetical protein